METLLIIIGFVFIILVAIAIGIISTFMIQVDVCGSDYSRDL
jgi:hypothetical protein